MDAGSGFDRELATGLADMDSGHELQFRLVLAVRAAVTAHRPRAEVATLMTELEEATRLHFMQEELLMWHHHWHRYEPHVAAHRRLLAELMTLKNDFDQGAPSEMMVALDQLQSWLATHVLGMDLAFARTVPRGSPAHGP
jgi:hemerythrin-like metal-binding protein